MVLAAVSVPSFFCFTEGCDIVFSLWGCHRSNERLQGLAFTSLSLSRSVTALQHVSLISSSSQRRAKFSEAKSVSVFSLTGIYLRVLFAEGESVRVSVRWPVKLMWTDKLGGIGVLHWSRRSDPNQMTRWKCFGSRGRLWLTFGGRSNYHVIYVSDRFAKSWGGRLLWTDEGGEELFVSTIFEWNLYSLICCSLLFAKYFCLVNTFKW